MMQSVLDEFDEKVNEIDLYFSLLRTLEEPDLVLAFATRPQKRRKNVDQHWLTILKASAFLILYNLVESAIRGGFGAVYEAIRHDGCSCADLREEFQKLWVDQQFGRIEQQSASPRTYQDKAQELVKHILDSVVVEMSERKLPVSGNLDAQKIRDVCSKHGVSVKTHQSALGGYKMRIVKDLRNELAHGHMSFSECGRQYTTADLEQIKKQVVNFVRSILRNIGRFVARREYAH
jgi:MAE_28990/MAE_18760-like HEPN